MNKQDAPFLDLRMCSSKFGFSARGVGGLLVSLGLCTLGAPEWGWTEKYLPWHHGAAEPRRRLCLCPALHRSPGPLCRSRAWWVAAPRWWASSASLRQLLWSPPSACAAAVLGDLLPVGGDETVKPAPRKQSLCHLPPSTRVDLRGFLPSRLSAVAGFALSPLVAWRCWADRGKAERKEQKLSKKFLGLLEG